MNYIIVNSKDFDRFVVTARTLQKGGFKIAASYIGRFVDPVEAASGEWGALRSAQAFPAAPIYAAPDVEYRFSAADDAWLANGERTEYSDFVGNSLYKYFVDAEWGDL